MLLSEIREVLRNGLLPGAFPPARFLRLLPDEALVLDSHRGPIDVTADDDAIYDPVENLRFGWLVRPTNDEPHHGTRPHEDVGVEKYSGSTRIPHRAAAAAEDLPALQDRKFHPEVNFISPARTPFYKHCSQTAPITKLAALRELDRLLKCSSAEAPC